MKFDYILNTKNKKTVISSEVVFGILLIVLIGVFVPTHVANAASACTKDMMELATPFAGVICGFETLIKTLGVFLMGLSSLVLIICGSIFDWIVEFSIIKMATNIGDPAGVGGAITNAWATLRDIANMCFIFVLLFAAFKAMFDANFGNFQTTIRNIIIVALLINFSLFFSKVVIDASNVVSVGFYHSITTSTSTLKSGQTTYNSTGISAGYINMLRLQTFFDSDILDPSENSLDTGQILTISILSSVFMLITAVILLIAGIMFATRFIILVFLMILSPLALIAYILPGQSKKFDEWKDALISQSFFAPLFFALTWVVFRVGTSLLKVLDQIVSVNGTSTAGATWSQLATAPQSVMALVINYVLIIGFSIAALVISKSMASKTPGFKQISGGIGTVALGGAALAGRNTIGRASGFVSEKYRDSLSKTAVGRAGLWFANKGKGASFDARGIADTKLGKSVGASDAMGIAGKAGGKGGFAKAIDDKAKEKAKYAKDVYGQTETEKTESKKLEDKYNVEKFAEENRIKNERTSEASRRLAAAANGTEEEKKAAKDYEKEVAYRNKNKIFKDDEYTEAFKTGIKTEYEKYSKAGERRQEEFAKRLEKSENVMRTAGGIVGTAIGGLVGGIPGATLGGSIGSSLGSGNKAAAKKIRDESKGPSKEKKLADAYKAIADTDTTADTATPTTPAAAPATPTPPSGGGSNRFE